MAAFAVVLFHLDYAFGDVGDETAAHRLLGPGLLSKGIDELAGIGSLGVNFFFLLSGFVLAYNYLGPDGMVTTRRAFFLARFARIYPVYLFALALSVAFHVLVQSPCTDAACAEGDSPAVAIGSLFLVQAWLPVVGAAFNGPGWTLSVEAMFYVCFPLLLGWVSRARSRRALTLVVVLALVATQTGTVLASTVDPGSAARTWIQFSPLLRLPEFTLGIAAWCWLRAHGSPRWLRDWHTDVLLLAGIPVVVVLGKLVTRAGIDPIAVNLGLFDAWFLLLIIALATGHGYVTRLLGTPSAQVLGESSYSLYILHWPVWFWFAWMLGVGTAPSLLELVIYSVAVVVIAVVVWACLERPARRRILGQRRAAAISTAAG